MKKGLVFRQNNYSDCAVCSLASIIKYYGGIPNIEKLREIMHTTRDGTTAYNILECAEELGFKSNGIKINNLEEFKNVHSVSPFIAHVIINNSYMHYVVVYKINFNNRTLKIMDPARGFVNMDFDEFNKIWTNIVLTFIPIKKIVNLNFKNQLYNTIKNIFKNYKSIFLFIICLSLIIFVLTLSNSYLTKYIIDMVTNKYNNPYKIIGIVFIVIILFQNIFEYLQNELVIYLSCKIEFILNTTTLSHIIKLPYDYFKTKTSGDIISRISDLNNIKSSLVNFIVTIFLNVIILIISSIILINISNHLFFTSSIFILLSILFQLIFIPSIKNIIGKVQVNNSNSVSYMLEIISAFESIKAMNNHKEIIYNYENKLIDYLNSKIRFDNILNRNNFFKNLLYSLATFSVVYLSYTEITNGRLSISSFILFNSIYNYFINSIKSIMLLIPDIEYYSKSISRINNLFEIDKENFIDKNINKVNNIKGEIKFIDVSYEINNTDEILKNINISIKEGSKIAIIGSTGSGKSTFLKLLLRYYKINEGKILINNKNILDYNIEDIRNNICYVSQNETLFTKSIYDNIVMDRNINYDYFLKICKICEVDKIVENKYLRYDHLLEENGFNISGGEKARIILARSLIKTSNIYIFDEALKELDSLTEKRILYKIFNEFSNCTFLVVTHKMDNLNMFDNILYVNNVTDL